MDDATGDEHGAERRAPYDPMPHGRPEVGVGPWEGPWPAGVGEPDGFGVADYALRPVAVARWRRLVFVHVGPMFFPPLQFHLQPA